MPDARRTDDREHEDRLVRVEETLARMEELLTPISETYTTATKVGKWIMGFSVFVSIGIGIILSIKTLFHR